MSARIETLLATIFGAIFIALSLLVTVEVVARKFFGIALEGSFELGGYALAVGSTLAFTLALFGRNHIRIDILHDRLPAAIRAMLNLMSLLLMAAFAGLLGYLSVAVIADTLDYRSTAQTSWATPLIYPQSAWLAGQMIFMLVSFALLCKGVWLLVRGRVGQIDDEFHPKSIKQELEEELDNMTERSVMPERREEVA
ncbi:TRAP transporter small permease subunit [Marinobacterium lutimaris]|uniref:TRAP transporter small permease protein n=1 Tax=Marinobacterium lutimaris TaxID=568106 RepID=A0A1H6DLW3_9GAMM|nr:TRAP transporter small permease [Marinobacterium lutimaris]SEG86188.1 TRAP-type C4-dicarboxylate transport system, small permease component [Marinobacterium lutimaris]